MGHYWTRAATEKIGLYFACIISSGRTRHDPAIIVANGRSRNAKAVLYVGSVYLATWHFFVPNHQHDPLHRLPTSTIAHSAGSQHRTPSPLHCLRREPASGLRGFRMEPASTVWAVSCSDLDTYVINFNARARSIEVARAKSQARAEINFCTNEPS
jgi:hypothetical protein